MLNEADSLALLVARGIPAVAHRLCRSRAEAIAAFETIGGPVVVKGCSADIAHKSELGLVKLGVTSVAVPAVAAADARHSAAPTEEINTLMEFPRTVQRARWSLL